MKNVRIIKGSNRGMTLVELVVAIALVAIVFAAAIVGVVNGYSSVASNKTIEDASMQAQGIADTVTTKLNEIASADSSQSEMNAAVTEAVKALSTDNDFEFIDGINGSAENFPSEDYGVQVLVKTATSKIENSGGNTEFYSYKITVAVPCASADGSSTFAQVNAEVISSLKA